MPRLRYSIQIGDSRFRVQKKVGIEIVELDRILCGHCRPLCSLPTFKLCTPGKPPEWLVRDCLVLR